MLTALIIIGTFGSVAILGTVAFIGVAIEHARRSAIFRRRNLINSFNDEIDRMEDYNRIHYGE